MRLRHRARSLLAVARDVVGLVFAPRADGHPRSLPGAIRDLRAYASARRASASGHDVEAAAAAARLLAVHPDLSGALAIVGSVSSRRGELSTSLAATTRLRAIADSPGLARRERSLQGRLSELEPGWVPVVPGTPQAIVPRAPNVVMHLLKQSLPDRQSGDTIRSRETLRAQCEAGLEPFVVTPYGFPPVRASGVAPDVEVIDGIAHHRLAPGATTTTMLPEEILSRTASLAAEVARTERPAIIQAASGFRGYDNAIVGLALGAHLQRPVVYEVRGFMEASWTSDPALGETAELTRLRTAKEDGVLAAVDAVTVLSAAMRDELVVRGVPSERIVIVPNGIDPAAFEPVAPDVALRRRYGLEDRWVFGYVSSMDHPREGHELLVEAATRLVRSGRRATCLIVGDGSRRPQLEALAAEAPPGAVVFAGRIPHDAVRDHLALLDAFVVPRVADRAARFVTPLKPYEAMAMGLPLVVSDLPALTEIAAPDARGLAFRAGDAEALVAVLERLMDTPGLGARLGAAGRAWVLAERTWAADGPRYRDLYRAVLERFDRDGPAAAP